jgi:hypothetical protein
LQTEEEEPEINFGKSIILEHASALIEVNAQDRRR